MYISIALEVDDAERYRNSLRGKRINTISTPHWRGSNTLILNLWVRL